MSGVMRLWLLWLLIVLTVIVIPSALRESEICHLTLKRSEGANGRDNDKMVILCRVLGWWPVDWEALSSLSVHRNPGTAGKVVIPPILDQLVRIS